MLPKKRKFDLSKFDLETSSPGPSRTTNAASRSPSVSAPSPTSHNPALPSASLFQIRSEGGHDATNLVSLPIFAAKGLPASGFLTPETVHEAFAGTFLRTSAQASASGTKSGVLPRSSPSMGVDLTQRSQTSSVTLSTVGLDHPGSAFSRPPAAPNLPRPPSYGGEGGVRVKTNLTRPALVTPKREVRPAPAPDFGGRGGTPVSSFSSSPFRSRDGSVLSSPSIGYYMDQGKVIAVSNPDYNVERTEVISSGKQAEYVGLNLTKPTSQSYEGRARRVELDLSEWVGHRVLALRGEYYFPGVIRDIVRTSEQGRDVTVLFDGDSAPLSYKNVLASTDKPPIISDAIPLTNQVSIGSKFCVKMEHPRACYAEALVYEVCRQPPQFLVKLPGGGVEGGEKTWVRRAQLRLTAPPWQEELATAQEAPLLPLFPHPGPSQPQSSGTPSLPLLPTTELVTTSFSTSLHHYW